MDNNTSVIFQSDLLAQLELIKRIVGQLQNRAEGLQADDIVRLESAAYQIHNLYSRPLAEFGSTHQF